MRGAGGGDGWIGCDNSWVCYLIISTLYRSFALLHTEETQRHKCSTIKRAGLNTEEETHTNTEKRQQDERLH